MKITSSKLSCEVEKQYCGYTFNIIFLIVFVGFIIAGTLTCALNFSGKMTIDRDVFHVAIFFGLGSAFNSSFFFSAVYWPSYLSRNPSAFKILPFSVGTAILWGIFAHQMIFNKVLERYFASGIALSAFIILNILVYLGYIKNDAEGVSWIKPWVYKPKFVEYPYEKDFRKRILTIHWVRCTMNDRFW